MENGLKIAFSGPSGLGKTTLCRYVEQEKEVPWMSTSAGHILTHKDKFDMKENFGYSGQGHKAVIDLSSIDPAFGRVFQTTLLRRRVQQIESNPSFVVTMRWSSATIAAYGIPRFLTIVCSPAYARSNSSGNLFRAVSAPSSSISNPSSQLTDKYSTYCTDS